MFYNGTFNFKKIENISLSQQTDITNNITETNTQTMEYVDNNYLNNNKIATVIVNPTPSLTDNYIWIPVVSDNVVPGLDSLKTYTHSKYAALAALQNSITNINDFTNNEIQNIQTEITNIEPTNQQNVIKYLHYHTNHTDFMYQRDTTKNDNRRSFITQRNYFTYQRKYNTNNLELMTQTLQQQVNQMQTHINNLSSDGGGGDGGEDSDIGTM